MFTPLDEILICDTCMPKTNVFGGKNGKKALKCIFLVYELQHFCGGWGCSVGGKKKENACFFGYKVQSVCFQKKDKGDI